MFPHEQHADSIEHAQLLSRTRYFWWINYLTDYTDWDFLWEPPPWQSHQRHAWPSQHQPDSQTYLVPKQPWSDTNYHTAPVLHAMPDPQCWWIPEWIDAGSIDSRWSPDPASPPYIYEFPVEWGWHNVCGPEYRVPGAQDRKYVYDFVARTKADNQHWHTVVPCQLSDQLARWRPCPIDPPYIYVFGNQWHSAEVMPTVEYRVPGATQRKYINELVATLPVQPHGWQQLEICDFDRSWVPDPGDPPYIYVFGNQWYPAEQWPTIEYHAPGAVQRKFMTLPVAKLPPKHDNHWATLIDCDWDYSWRPDPGDPPYIYVFGNQWHSAEVMPTVEYRVPGASQRKFMTMPVAKLLPDPAQWEVPADVEGVDLSWVPDPGSPPYIYQFGTQHQKTGGPRYVMPDATDITYVDHPRATKISIDPNWTIPDGADIANFDLTWHPDHTEPPYIYQFATQHQKTGGPIYTVTGATETKYLEHVQVKITTGTVPVVEIDHLDGHAGMIVNTVKTVRYFDNYRDTLLRIARNLKGQHEWVWICSSICDYTKFDFSWHPEQWQSTMLHVFASDEQKFGDTFYMHVPTFAERAEKKQLLEWYSVNFVPKIRVPRRPVPVIVHDKDSHVDAVKTLEFTAPLALFTVEPHIDRAMTTVSLWRQETKTITPVSSGATAVIVPKAAVADIKTQLYDYPHIDKTRVMLKSQPLDVVFISNGESNADQNYLQITMCLANNAQNKNRVHVVKGINGRVAAYHAAAEASTTPWFFAVFAKLEVASDFDWSWQPDRMQQPKHYIFHARNPVNGLVYGHQAMIAYNKQLVLSNPGVGLDFTLDSAHEVVPVISGVAHYNTSPWSSWRTAFREVIKLRASLPDVENEFRLQQWLTVDHVQDQWSIQGAKDAIEYYQEVNGDLTALRKSYEWTWLASYAFVKHGIASK